MLDDLPLIDPSLQSIEEKRKIGLWPPSPDCIADSIYPYIRRMKKASVNILDVGTFLGETAYRLLELDTIGKIEKITSFPTLRDAFVRPKAEQNLKGTRAEILVHVPDIKFDVVMINSEVEQVRAPDCSLDGTMKIFYNMLESGGIFCGNEHDKTPTKEALGKFRRTSKIGTPILISNKTTWFWVKR
jgi:hypothetical protein